MPSPRRHSRAFGTENAPLERFRGAKCAAAPSIVGSFIGHPAQAQQPDCLADFADGLFTSQMREHRIAGITFAAIYNDGADRKSVV